MFQDTPKAFSTQTSADRASLLADACYAFLKPLLLELHTSLDRRLVANLLRLIFVIVRHRHNAAGLLLSELGGQLLSPAQAPAGTKRLSRLLHSERWTSETLLRFLWHTADQRVQALRSQHETPLVVWDESVLEKPESLALEGLCPVRSTKAVRLKRIKPGYFNPPGGRPICVPGWNWLAVLVMGQTGTPTLARLAWWTTRGERAEAKRTVEYRLLREAWRAWGGQVLHIWDRGFAGWTWLRVATIYQLHWVLRWPKAQHLRGFSGQVKKAWELTRGKRSWGHRQVWDARRRCWRRVGVVAVPVYDLATDAQRWLVVARPGGGREPWYLLTTERIESEEQAWRVVFAYARRWQVEMAIRFDKCELAFASPRLREWEARCKLWAITALAYAFLLSLLAPLFQRLCEWLLRNWCHRTGKWSREVSAPLYRLRSALSRLWLAHPPPGLATLDSG